jgi:hypothetical protein
MRRGHDVPQRGERRDPDVAPRAASGWNPGADSSRATSCFVGQLRVLHYGTIWRVSVRHPKYTMRTSINA